MEISQPCDETPSLKVAVCLLLCDRKAHMQTVALPSMLGQDYENCIFYVNIQRDMGATEPDREKYKPLIDALDASGRPYHLDFWQWNESTWWKKPAFDQDQARLVPIVMARNMSVDFSLDIGAEKMMFVDSDMKIPKNSVSTFLSYSQFSHMGGLVPGRGAHKEARYVFQPTVEHPDRIECDHGNIGFSFIDRHVFSRLRFRRGVHPTKGHPQSDDPNFCSDAEIVHRFGRHQIIKSLVASHEDDTVTPWGGAQF